MGLHLCPFFKYSAHKINNNCKGLELAYPEQHCLQTTKAFFNSSAVFGMGIIPNVSAISVIISDGSSFDNSLITTFFIYSGYQITTNLFLTACFNTVWFSKSS